MSDEIEEGKVMAAEIIPEELSKEAREQLMAIYQTMQEEPEQSVSIPKDSPLGLYLAEHSEEPSEEEIERIRKFKEGENRE